MPDYTVTAETAPIEVGASGQAEIVQNVRTILTTLRQSLPLDRDFARPGDAIDAPQPKAVSREVAELYRAIQRHEPRVEVTDIRFVQSQNQAMDGQLVPQVRIRIKQGVL